MTRRRMSHSVEGLDSEWVSEQLRRAPKLTPDMAARLSRLFFPDGSARFVLPIDDDSVPS